MGKAKGPAMEITGTHSEIDVDECATMLKEASSVIIVPGYGLAVAKAQYAVAEIAKLLNDAVFKLGSRCTLLLEGCRASSTFYSRKLVSRTTSSRRWRRSTLICRRR